VLRIRDVNPGSGFFYPGLGLKKATYRIPNPVPQQKNVCIFKPKILTKLWEIRSGMFIPNPGFRGSGFFSIPDPGFKKETDPGSGSATNNLSIFNPKNIY
jgi:hypothetical protein